MENDVFINKLINGTKNGILEWKPAKSIKLHSIYQPYYIQNGDKKLVLEKYSTIEYDGYGEEIQSSNCMISICDNEFNTISEIFESDLKKSSDLWRLYRLAERKANNVDDIMESFITGIKDIDF